MKVSKTAVSFVVISMFALNAADALAQNVEEAPQKTIESCVAQVGEVADYKGATRVRHEVASKARRSSGHTLNIQTQVYGENGAVLLRQYESRCAVDGWENLDRFDIQELSD